MRKTRKLAGRKSVAALSRRVVCVTAAGIMTLGGVFPVFAQDKQITPNEADYGYYVDEYWKNGDAQYRDTIDNPANGVLSQMLNYYTPVHQWDNKTEGYKLGIFTADGEKIQMMNLMETAKIGNNATDAEKELAYFDDRRDKNYSVINGLGAYADEFREKSGAKTAITKVPDNAGTVQEFDPYDDNLWNEDDTNPQYVEIKDYKGIVNLVKLTRNTAASTSRVKRFYNFSRPFRWNVIDAKWPEVEVLSTLLPCVKADPSDDGGYPSGHTNAANLAAIAYAYAVPEQYSDMMLRSSEFGNSRIVAGMHSCLDVMGGRVMSTAIAASALYNSDNAEIKATAAADGEKLVKAVAGEIKTVEDTSDYDSYQKDKATYLYRMTYDIKLDNADTTKEMKVPKGAEALLETRYPYLDADQIRWILYTTGISSGYSVLDDEEGWGRLNLFEAANGYGSFVQNVTVDMDSTKGGFNAADNWKNDIDGSGSLTKNGTGMLVLSGNNSYTGGTTVNEGTIRVDYRTSLGDGKVSNNGAIVENTKDTVVIGGDYTQSKDSELTLTVSNVNDFLNIEGKASFGGKLIIKFDGFTPDSDMEVIKCASVVSKFDSVKVILTDGSEAKAEYTETGIKVVKNNGTDGNNNVAVQDKDTVINKNENTNTGDTTPMAGILAGAVLAAGAVAVAAVKKKRV